MMTRKMMALAAVPVAALLAGGGVAAAQVGGAPSGTAVVQQTAVHHPGDPCHGRHARPGQMMRPGNGPSRHDGDHGIQARHRDGTCDRDHGGLQRRAGLGAGLMAPGHHGEHHGMDQPDR